MTIDRTHDVPLLAGANDAGGKTYIDRRMPARLRIGGKSIDPAKYLHVHEQVEHALMTRSGMGYPKAHELATATERKAVERDGIDWKRYTGSVSSYVKQAGAETPQNPPADLYLAPYSKSQADQIRAARKRVADQIRKR